MCVKQNNILAYVTLFLCDSNISSKCPWKGHRSDVSKPRS